MHYVSMHEVMKKHRIGYRNVPYSMLFHQYSYPAVSFDLLSS